MSSTTRDLLYAYDTIFDQKQRQVIESLIGGMQDGLGWANAELFHRGQPVLYCQPDKLAITHHQMVDMVRREKKEKPGLGDLPLGGVVLHALQDTFPCKE